MRTSSCLGVCSHRHRRAKHLPHAAIVIAITAAADAAARVAEPRAVAHQLSAGVLSDARVHTQGGDAGGRARAVLSTARPARAVHASAARHQRRLSGALLRWPVRQELRRALAPLASLGLPPSLPLTVRAALNSSSYFCTNVSLFESFLPSAHSYSYTNNDRSEISQANPFSRAPTHRVREQT